MKLINCHLLGKTLGEVTKNKLNDIQYDDIYDDIYFLRFTFSFCHLCILLYGVQMAPLNNRQSVSRAPQFCVKLCTKSMDMLNMY